MSHPPCGLNPTPPPSPPLAPRPPAAATPSRIVWQASAFEQLGHVPWGDLGETGCIALPYLPDGRRRAVSALGIGVHVARLPAGVQDQAATL